MMSDDERRREFSIRLSRVEVIVERIARTDCDIRRLRDRMTEFQIEYDEAVASLRDFAMQEDD